MKKIAILFVAGALALGACGKKKDTTTPATGDNGNPAGEMGGDAYGTPAGGGDAYGAPAEGNPCGDGAANPCG
jgi:hypothetical protein